MSSLRPRRTHQRHHKPSLRPNWYTRQMTHLKHHYQWRPHVNLASLRLGGYPQSCRNVIATDVCRIIRSHAPLPPLSRVRRLALLAHSTIRSATLQAQPTHARNRSRAQVADPIASHWPTRAASTPTIPARPQIGRASNFTLGMSLSSSLLGRTQKSATRVVRVAPIWRLTFPPARQRTTSGASTTTSWTM